MDFERSERQKQLKAEVSEFLRKEITEQVILECAGSGYGAATRAFLRRFGARGWLAPMLPLEYGGLDYSNVDTLLIYNELGYWGGPGTGSGVPATGGPMIGPALLDFGSEEQKSEYLPRIASGEIEFALGYTEPEAGSDVASLRIRAENKGDYYLLNGQKIFNTNAHFAEYHWLAARTNPDVSKHRGLSVFIVDLKSPGITIEPWPVIGGLMTNIVYYEDVKVAKENLVGEENKGWTVMLGALGIERLLGSGGVGRTLHDFDAMVEYVAGNEALSSNILIRQELSEALVRLRVAELMGYRAAWILDRKITPTHEFEMAKVCGSEASQYFYDVAMRIMGHYGQLQRDSKYALLEGEIAHGHQHSFVSKIVGGTSEIQRYVIALRGLGLPRGPR